MRAELAAMRAEMQQQDYGFRRVAHEYQERARDVEQVEVAQSTARLRMSMSSSLDDASNRLRYEDAELRQLSVQLQQAQHGTQQIGRAHV